MAIFSNDARGAIINGVCLRCKLIPEKIVEYSYWKARYCKKCYTLYRQEHYVRNMEKMRFNYLNLSIKTYQEILIRQNYKCPICEYEFKCVLKSVKQERVDAHPDHSHITGLIRGILCPKCNNGLGLFRDNIMYLENAIKYLKQDQI